MVQQVKDPVLSLAVAQVTAVARASLAREFPPDAGVATKINK